MTLEITHLMRAPLIGGSECETLTIVRTLRGFRHRVVYPARCAELGPSLAPRFPADTPLIGVDDVEAELRDRPPALLHIQFPFVLEPRPRGLDSVLELRSLPPVPTIFTVHAAVNVPVVDELHYLFHTERQAAEFEGRIPRARITICGSLVTPPATPTTRPDDGRVVIQWVSRNEDAKFHPALGAICEQVLAACPAAELRFVGRPREVDLPAHPRLSITACPVDDLDAIYRGADLFWAFPDPRLVETWGRTVTEALGHGLPCVVAAHGALSEQVADGVHGRVVDSPTACAEALVELVRDAEARRAMSARATARARALHDEARTALEDLYARTFQESVDVAAHRTR